MCALRGVLAARPRRVRVSAIQRSSVHSSVGDSRPILRPKVGWPPSLSCHAPSLSSSAARGRFSSPSVTKVGCAASARECDALVCALRGVLAARPRRVRVSAIQRSSVHSSVGDSRPILRPKVGWPPSLSCHAPSLCHCLAARPRRVRVGAIPAPGSVQSSDAHVRERAGVPYWCIPRPGCVPLLCQSVSALTPPYPRPAAPSSPLVRRTSCPGERSLALVRPDI